MAWAKGPDGVESFWEERNQVFKSVAGTAEHDNSNLSLRQILLELKILVSSQKDAEAGPFSRVEQRAVLEPCPGLLLYGSNVVTGQERRELPRELLIE